MREASTSDWSCASRSAAARLAGCRIARRPALGFCCCWALSDAGWSRFPHGTHSSRLCAGFRHRFAAADKSQRRPLTPRAVNSELLYEQIAKLGLRRLTIDLDGTVI